MKITISQEGTSPISITVPDNINNKPEVKSQEGIIAGLVGGFLVFYLICCLIAIPFIVKDKCKNKRLLKLAEDLLSKMSESEKKEIKDFINETIKTQNDFTKQSMKLFNDTCLKHIKNNGIKIYANTQNIAAENEIVDNNDLNKSTNKLLKKIIKYFENKSSEEEFESCYELDSCIVLLDYYNEGVSFDKYDKAFDDIDKDLKILSKSNQISIDKSKFSTNLFIGGLTEGESCPDGPENACAKYLCTNVSLTVNKKYINKVFKPLFDKCKDIK